MKALPFLLLILVVLPCLIHPTIASKLTFELRNRAASVTIASSLHQNFTKLQDRTVTVTGQDLGIAKEALDRAIKAKLNGAVVSDLAIRITMSQTMLNVTATFKTSNITSVSGNIAKADCVWKSFDVPDDLASQGVSYNMVGKAYVEPIILSYANSSSARFYLNETNPVFGPTAASIAGNATLLDFSILSKPLASWNMTMNLEKQETVWFFPAEKLLDLRATVEEPNATRTYYSMIEVSSEIIGPTFAAIDGNIITINETGLEEPLMLSAVIVILAITLGMYVYQRRVRKKEARPRR